MWNGVRLTRDGAAMQAGFTKKAGWANENPAQNSPRDRFHSAFRSKASGPPYFGRLAPICFTRSMICLQ